MSRQKIGLLATLTVLVLCFAIQVQAAPLYKWEVEATNNSGAVRTDLHMLFIGTGGSIAAVNVIENDGPGKITGTAVVGGNEIRIDWDGDGIAVGNTVKVEFTTTNPTVTLSEPAYWTPDSVAVDPAPTMNNVPVPTLSQWGLLVLLLAVVVSGVLFLRRRRAAAV